jgi:hypothetical protein
VVGPAMTTFEAIMFGVMLALTPSLVALAFFLFREWIITCHEGAAGLGLHDPAHLPKETPQPRG